MRETNQSTTSPRRFWTPLKRVTCVLAGLVLVGAAASAQPGSVSYGSSFQVLLDELTKAKRLEEVNVSFRVPGTFVDEVLERVADRVSVHFATHQ